MARAPSVARIIDAFPAYYQTAAVRAAVEPDMFTASAEGEDTAAALAARCHSAPRGIRILCDYLTVIGLLEKEEDRYRLGADAAAFLDRRSPAYLGSAGRY